MVAIKAEIRREVQEGIVFGHMSHSLTEPSPQNKWGPVRFETYLDPIWPIESWETQVTLLFFSRFCWAPRAEGKTTPTDDYNWPTELAAKGAVPNRSADFIREGTGFPWNKGLLCLCLTGIQALPPSLSEGWPNPLGIWASPLLPPKYGHQMTIARSSFE